MKHGDKYTADGRKFQQEVVVSGLVDEEDLCLVMYDIVSLTRNPDDFSCDQMRNENFVIDKDVTEIHGTHNPRHRFKHIKSLKGNNQQASMNYSKAYSRIPSDKEAKKVIPEGFKIIGIKGYKRTFED